MDAQNCAYDEFRHCLQSLETINNLTLAYYPTLRWLEFFIKNSVVPLHIVDIGCGCGDMLRRFERLFGKRKQSVILTGLDYDPLARRCALSLMNKDSAINYICTDIFDYQPEQGIDIAVCSLFTHHLEEDQLVRFLCWLDQNTRCGWFINDLHRHWLPYYFIKVATAVLSRNRLIRNDAPVSVARAFIIRDWEELLEKAGLHHSARIQWFFPFRLCVSCRK